MDCGCKDIKNNGQKIADLVRGKGFDQRKPSGNLTINCECGNSFTMDTLVCKCPNCNLTYAVTPCSSGDISNVAIAGYNY
ncbi:MAG: hypothetical protein ACRC57_02395 [Sarcina sp.]